LSLDDLQAIREAARTSTRTTQNKTYGEETPSDFEDEDDDDDEEEEEAYTDNKSQKRKKSSSRGNRFSLDVNFSLKIPFRVIGTRC